MKLRKSEGAERALAVALDEARRVPSPELDWDSLESKLDRARSAPAPVASVSRPSRLVLSLLPAAAALGLVGIFALRSPPSVPAEAPAKVASSAPETTRDGDALSPEDVVASDAEAVAVVHAGRARWTLEPHGRALVLSHGDVVRVRLIAGALKADVTPSPEPERFVVEAAGTRVAVHGTLFRVQLQGEQTLVDVEQGVVSVGPREQPSVSTALLRGPTRGAFTLEGAALSPGTPAHTASLRLVVSHPNRVPSGAASSESDAPDAAPAASARHPLTIGEAEAGVAVVVTAVSRCFKEHTEDSHNVRVSARTELTLDVTAEGAVSEVSFSPPLSPVVQACGQREALLVPFAPSLEGARLTRVLELGR